MRNISDKKLESESNTTIALFRLTHHTPNYNVGSVCQSCCLESMVLRPICKSLPTCEKRERKVEISFLQNLCHQNKYVYVDDDILLGISRHTWSTATLSPHVYTTLHTHRKSCSNSIVDSRRLDERTFLHTLTSQVFYSETALFYLCKYVCLLTV